MEYRLNCSKISLGDLCAVLNAFSFLLFCYAKCSEVSTETALQNICIHLLQANTSLSNLVCGSRWPACHISPFSSHRLLWLLIPVLYTAPGQTSVTLLYCRVEARSFSFQTGWFKGLFAPTRDSGLCGVLPGLASLTRLFPCELWCLQFLLTFQSSLVNLKVSHVLSAHLTQHLIVVICRYPWAFRLPWGGYFLTWIWSFSWFLLHRRCG